MICTKEQVAYLKNTCIPILSTHSALSAVYVLFEIDAVPMETADTPPSVKCEISAVRYALSLRPYVSQNSYDTTLYADMERKTTYCPSLFLWWKFQ
jgi:hypothetical protein